MALQEARCINCGSILMVDGKQEKAHCLFCDCVFDSKEGIKATSLPADHEFPNKPQPKYEGESLQPSPGQRVKVPVPIKQSPVRAKEVEEPFERKVKTLPKVAIPFKTKMILTATMIAVVGIVCAILIPLLAKRDRQQAAIKADLVQNLAEYKVKAEEVNVLHLQSDFAVIVTAEKIAEEDVAKIFNKYSEARAAALGIDKNDFAKTKSPLTLQIATPTGGYLVREPQAEADILGSALKKLR